MLIRNQQVLILFLKTYKYKEKRSGSLQTALAGESSISKPKREHHQYEGPLVPLWGSAKLNFCIAKVHPENNIDISPQRQARTVCDLYLKRAYTITAPQTIRAISRASLR